MMDLDEPADVYWPEEVPSNVVRGEHKRSCETLADAVRFVMELPEALRSVAYIAAAGSHLDSEKTERRTFGEICERVKDLRVALILNASAT